jgi:CubicO group peptidase (beta-lactamase class C family)
VNRVELAAFIDGLMTAYLRDKKIAGATVSVVRDTTVLFAKGYGWADFDKRTPVDAALRLFRVGSITKTFTWTAVMQLVEQGKLDLDRDINSYLDFRIPATYAEPITLEHVLTHTAGFEEDSRDLFATDSARITPRTCRSACARRESTLRTPIGRRRWPGTSWSARRGCRMTTTSIAFCSNR